MVITSPRRNNGDLQLYQFGTKAQNLNNLFNVITSAKVLPSIIIPAYKRKEKLHDVVSEIRRLEWGDSIIVRSSSRNEDRTVSSNAGAYISVPWVPSNDLMAVEKALEQVALSMPNADDELLIQPMLKDLKIVGVATTVDKDNLSPYYCIEYDAKGRHDSITGGSEGSETQTFFLFRDKECPNIKPFKDIIGMLKELEFIFESTFLDVEFAIDKDETLYCLQVRPLVLNKKLNYFKDINITALNQAERTIKSIFDPKKDICGKKSLLGMMPDWNPAEMIGVKPRTLASSMYEELITDNVWAMQRSRYGYKQIKHTKLMELIEGVPFIDVRASFNSFIPNDISKNLTEKLLNYYIEYLKQNNQYHDKVEFKVIHTCFDFSTNAKVRNAAKKIGLSEFEITKYVESLKHLTINIIKNKDLFYADLRKAECMDGLFTKIKARIAADYDNFEKYPKIISRLVRLCKYYGTLPFAGIARAAFISVSLLNSMVDQKIISKERKEDFLSSLQTISGILRHDVSLLTKQNTKQFLIKYGHLRAGTYNIMSPRYDEDFDGYFDLDEYHGLIHASPKNKLNDFALTTVEKNNITHCLQKESLDINPEILFNFFKISIEGREYSKFQFTKVISLILQMVGRLGRTLGFEQDDMSFTSIKTILKLSDIDYDKYKSILSAEIQSNRLNYRITQAIKLPAVICQPTDLYYFSGLKAQPFFITQKSISSKVANPNSKNLKGRIVLIKSADPGFDYLFTKGISGFITCYGGMNSHMAIRASEMKLPAAVGVGEEAFARYSRATWIKMDCSTGQIICH